ncbi:MAG: acyl-CoA dehydrogenase family protein [Sneathiella sp.]
MTSFNVAQSALLKKVEEFAASHIRPRRQELITATTFPKDMWQAFASSGLAGLSIPEKFAGLGANYSFLSAAAQCLSREGGVPGATMVFMSHWLISRLHIASDAPEKMKHLLLPALAKGEITISVAISEPGAGAHPKFLKTTARREGKNYVLTGEKAYLTNGPIADCFIIVAITDETDGKKAFSAILVPADNEGLKRTGGVNIDFLHPCPHGGIRLTDCRVSKENLIGKAGEAFARTSMRMRAIEDAVGAGSMVGSMQCLLNDLAQIAPEEKALEIGAIGAQIKLLEIGAAHLSNMADKENDGLAPMMEMQLGFHQQCQNISKAFAALIEELPSPLQIKSERLNRDISKSLTIARSAHAVRLTKIGHSIQKLSQSL